MSMKKFKLQYSLKILFDNEVHNHHFSLKCMPKTEARQMIDNLKIRLNVDYFSYSNDSFGNRFWYGYEEASHKDLDVYIEADAQVDWQKYETDSKLNTVFSLPTSQTQIGENLKPFLADCNEACKAMDNDYDKALCIMKMVHNCMEYKPNITTIKTTADEAYSYGMGVCQDYAQIVIAILRAMKIPARYVAGVMHGEKLTHAWVEVFAKNRWYGIDPTNDLLVNDDYIVFSRGRDYKDCLVNKGVFYSPVPVRQKQEILVNVMEV